MLHKRSVVPCYYSLCFLVFTCACLAREQCQLKECQLDTIQALKPDNLIESEGGVTETWNTNHPELCCTGVTVIKRTIHPNGLHLPSYVNYPELHFVVQGEGVLGIAIPGCSETYEEPQQGKEKEKEKEKEKKKEQDRHQKVRYVRQGDIFAVPHGVPYWTYNYANVSLVVITLLHTANLENQLDRVPRRFYLAGNPKEEHPSGRKQEEEDKKKNIFNGFEARFLAEVSNVKLRITKKLQSATGDKIMKVEKGLTIIKPPLEHEIVRREAHVEGEEEKKEKKEESNVVEESVCTMKLHENIADPSRADLFNPRAGRVRTINSFTLPVLKLLHLSAQWVKLYKNGIYVPQWSMNANSVSYVTSGRGHVQVVNAEGNAVFNGEVGMGEVVVVPQNFAVAIQAGGEGMEYVVFRTNDRAMIGTLVGPTSAITAIPGEVLENAFGLSPDEVSELKNNRRETILASPASHSNGDNPFIVMA